MGRKDRPKVDTRIRGLERLRSKSFLLVLAGFLAFWIFLTSVSIFGQTYLRRESKKQPLEKIFSSKSSFAYQEKEILVKFKPGASENEQKSAKLKAGIIATKERIRIKKRPLREIQLVRLGKGMSVKKAVQKLKLESVVEYAEPNYLRRVYLTPNDTSFGEQWGLNNTGQNVGGVSGTSDADIDAPETWDLETGGTNPVTVALLDSGIDLAHPDLDGKIWTNPGEAGGGKESNGVDDDGNGRIDDWRGWDFVNGDNDPDDDYGHGTAVGGVIAAESNNSQGMAGVSWEATIMPLKVMDASGNAWVSDILEAISYAVENNAKILNMSYGGAYSQAEEDALTYAYSQGLVNVAAVGNDGTTVIEYPAGDPNVIGVGATDQDDARASFSNYNSSVDVAAPGVNIYTTDWPSGYAAVNGTSLATPFVSGLAALVFSKKPNYTPDQVEQVIENFADDKGTPGRDDQYGYGRINAHATMLRFFGDINGDRTVNIFDLVIVGQAFGSQPGDSNWNPAADLNDDNTINIFDLVTVGQNFGRVAE